MKYDFVEALEYWLRRLADKLSKWNKLGLI